MSLKPNQLLAVGVLLLSVMAPARAASLTFSGSAAYAGPNNSFIRLTPAALGQRGSVWLTNKQKVTNGFRTCFYFRITNPGGDEGADGFAFVLQNVGNTALGDGGGGIGYQGIPRSVAVEFDTYENAFPGVNDPDNNHISIHTNGFGVNSADELFSVGSVSPIVNMSDGAVHRVRIAYVSGKMTVELDGVIVLSALVDITPALDALGGTYFGFTSATGAGFENHDLDGWCIQTF